MFLGAVLMMINKKDSKTIKDTNEIVDVKYTGYDFNLLNNYPYYTYEDDNYTSMFGIDVAAHQETIDWKKVKEAGVEFAFIRLGYRGASEGKLNVDLEFEYNYKNAIKNDIKVGVYWYSQPINEIEARQEAQFVLDVLNNRHLDFPIAYDFEETILDDELSRMHYTNKEDRTKMALAFCEEIEKANKEVMLYTYLYWAENYYDWSLLDKYPVWFAQYEEKPQFDRPFIIWQYSDNGNIDGINKPCDLNIMFIAKDK